MGLIRCSECSSQISSKASHCPNCGAPCLHYSSDDSSTNINTAVSGAAAETPDFVAKNKRNSLILYFVLGMVGLILVIIVFSSSSNNSSSAENPGNCTLYGEAPVYPASHDNGLCIPDGDGWYHVGFGHHHHK